LLGVAPQVECRCSRYAARDSDARRWNRARQGPQLRPDLRALQFGYQSQEQNLRKAVLAQFSRVFRSASGCERHDECPPISLGATLKSAAVQSQSGRIAVQAPRREQLPRRYQARPIKRPRRLAIWTEMQQTDGAIADIAARLPELQLAPKCGAAYYGGRFAGSHLCDAAKTRSQSPVGTFRSKAIAWSDAIALRASSGHKSTS